MGAFGDIDGVLLIDFHTLLTVKGQHDMRGFGDGARWMKRSLVIEYLYFL